MNHFAYRDGVLHAEDVPLPEIAAAVGTPFYCYSTATLVRHYRVFRDAFAGLDTLICYAMKANSNQAVIRTFVEEGAGLDVVSEGELRRALAAGGAPDKIVFAGVGKTAREIALRRRHRHPLLQRRIGAGARADLGDRRGQGRRRAAVAIRVNPDVDAKTHAKITTGKAENKFGIPFERAREVYAHAAALAGHQGHRRRHAYRQPDHRPRAVRRRLRAPRRSRPRRCAPTATRSTMSMPAAASASPTASTIRRRRSRPPMARSSAAASAISAARILFEPGRVFVGNAGILVSRGRLREEGRRRRPSSSSTPP